MGGGGGGAGASPALNPERRRRENVGGCGGYPPPRNFEIIGYRRHNFVRFGDSLLGNKAGKSEGH